MGNKVKITLEGFARNAAKEMRTLRGIETPDDFEGPVFDNVKNLHIHDRWVVVDLEDGTEYFYPAVTVARVASYPKE